MNYAFKSRFIGIEVLFLNVFFVKACKFRLHLDNAILFSTRASRSISLKVVLVVVVVVVLVLVTFCKNLKDISTNQHRWRIHYK